MSKKIMDERGRLFGVINIIDVIVILLAVVLVCSVYVKFSKNERTAAGSSDLQGVTYQMEIKTVREGTANNLKAGDKIWNQESGVELGTIREVSVTPGKLPKALADGTYAEGSVQDRYDVVLTIEGNCQILNGRYFANKSDEIRDNHEKKVQTKYCKMTGTVIGIDK